MKQSLFRAASLLLLASISGRATAQSGFALVRADLEKVEDISPPLRQGEIRLDGEMRLIFRVRKVLVGTLENKVITHVQWSGKPFTGDAYVLVHDKDGKLAVKWWGLARDGFCLYPEDARHYGMEDQVRRLQKVHPCRNGG
jgi:hypothetical protein